MDLMNRKPSLFAEIDKKVNAETAWEVFDRPLLADQVKSFAEERGLTDEDEGDNDPVIDDATAKSLAQKGVTVVQNAGKIILQVDATGALINLSRQAGKLLGSGIGVLDASAAEGLVKGNAALNIRDFLGNGGGAEVAATMQNDLSRGDFTRLVIRFAENEAPFRSIGGKAGGFFFGDK
ncbi:hypothetical protein JYT10_00080 [Beggiatoa alba]|nr:hypothetical protein [Beggiatoa alba]